MGLVETIRNIFGGSASGEKKEEAIGIEEAEALIKKRKGELEKELVVKSSAKIAEIKHLLRSIESELNEMDKRNLMEEGDNKYLRKIVSSSQKNMIKQMYALLERLQPKGIGTADGIKDYARESALHMQREILTYRKNISYTSIIMKEEIKNIGFLMQNLLNGYNVINGYFREANYDSFSEIEKQLGEREKKKALLSGKEAELSRIREAVEKLNQAIGEKENRIKAIESSVEFRSVKDIEAEIENAEKEKQAIKNGFSAMLSNADKAIRRFIKLVDAGIYIIEKQDEELLKLYMEDIVEASKKDPKAERFRAMLNEMKKAIDEGKLSLKEGEKEKRLKALDELAAYDYFTNIFWKLNELEKKRIALNKRLLDIDARRKMLAENDEKARFVNRKAEAEKGIEAQQREIGEMEKEIKHIEEMANLGFEKIFSGKIGF